MRLRPRAPADTIQRATGSCQTGLDRVTDGTMASVDDDAVKRRRQIRHMYGQQLY